MPVHTFVKNWFNIHATCWRHLVSVCGLWRSNPLFMPTVKTACLLVHKREAGERREKGNLQSLSGSLQATPAKGWLWSEVMFLTAPGPRCAFLEPITSGSFPKAVSVRKSQFIAFVGCVCVCDNFYIWLKASARLPGAATTATTRKNNKKPHWALRRRAQKVWAEIGGWCPGNLATWPLPLSTSTALPGPIKHWKKILKNNSFPFGGILSNLGASEPRDKKDFKVTVWGAGEGKNTARGPWRCILFHCLLLTSNVTLGPFLQFFGSPHSSHRLI